MTYEVGVQVGGELDVEVGVWPTPTSSHSPCRKAFPKIQLDVGHFVSESHSQEHTPLTNIAIQT